MRARKSNRPAAPVVMVGILKDRRDLRILLNRGWYRVPVASCPTRSFDHLAFYQPSGFGREGKRICRYARVVGRDVVKRRDLLPEEKSHPRADDDYYRFRVGTVRELPSPIRNRGPRRVTFGFTTLRRLLKARDVLQLFEVPPLEEIVARALKRAGIAAVPEHTVSLGKGVRYRLDFAIIRPGVRIDVECDGEKWHSGARQRERDRMRDRNLRRRGWTVVRFKERQILADPGGCVRKIRRELEKGGPVAGR